MILPLFFFLAALACLPAFACPHKMTGCKMSGVAIQDMPEVLPAPAAASPSYIAIALGTQNYTCTEARNYTSAGAFAELFDISCLHPKRTKDTLADDLWAFWENAPAAFNTQTVISLLLPLKSRMILGQHYFIPNPSTGKGLSPKWDFTSQGATKGNKEAFVIAAKSGGAPAPTGEKDIDWLALNSVSGSLADQVYRTDTRGGFAPTDKCAPGSAIAVKYVSKYWFYGGTVIQMQ